MKIKKVNMIYSVIYTVFALISSAFLIPEFLKGIHKYGWKETTVVYTLVMVIAMFIGIITSFLGAIPQIIGGFILAGTAGIGAIVIIFLNLIESLFTGYVELLPLALFYVAVVGLAVGKIILGFKYYKDVKTAKRMGQIKGE